MGNALPRRLSVNLAGSSFAPVLPVHEARSEEDRRRRTSFSRRGQSIELERLRTSFGNEEEQIHEREEESDLDLSEVEEEEGMPSTKHKKSKSRSPNPRTLRSHHQHQDSSDSTGISPTANGHAAGEMNGGFRERVGKHSTSIDSDGDSARHTARLMGRSSFSLDHAPPLSPMDKGGKEGGKSFFELPEQDRRNFLLLVLLYFLQGIPMGLAGGSVPFLLKSHLSYGQIGVYSLAIYPYSLKLLWSPIVDAWWSSRIGRRKSWILPIQTLSGFGMLWLGSRAEEMMEAAGEDNGAGVWSFTGWWFGLVLMCATQDIAVDGTDALRDEVCAFKC